MIRAMLGGGVKVSGTAPTNATQAYAHDGAFLASAPGATGNELQLLTVNPGTTDANLAVSFVYPLLTITLGTDGAGDLDPTKNTFGAVDALLGPDEDVEVNEGIDPALVISSVGGPSNFSGGADRTAGGPVMLVRNLSGTASANIGFWVLVADSDSGDPGFNGYEWRQLVAYSMWEGQGFLVCDDNHPLFITELPDENPGEDGRVYRSGGYLKVSGVEDAGPLITDPFIVAELPGANTVGVGGRFVVTDALTPTFGAAVVGGGAVVVPVYSDGTIWRVG